MFKLKKILNNRHNAPEPELLELEYDCFGKKECIYYLCLGKLNITSDANQRQALYVIYDEVDEMAQKRTVECVRITPDMIFEVDGTAFAQGDRFSLARDFEKGGFNRIEKVVDSTPSDGFVVDTSMQSTNGKILIRFHCTQ